MFTGEIIGKVGADAKPTEKGFFFPVAHHYKDGEEERTQWIQCFANYTSGVIDYLKTGTLVYVSGDMTLGIYQNTPTATMNVTKVKLLPGNKPKE